MIDHDDVFFNRCCDGADVIVCSLGCRCQVINAVFSPTQKEIDYAYEVMEAIETAKAQGKGAIALHGKMIDAPIVARAQQTISMAEELGLGRGN